MDWSDLLKKHGPALVLYARQWTGVHADAEEAVQDSFIRLWRSGHDLQDNPLPLLYLTAKSCAIDLVRGRTRRSNRETAAAGESDGLSWFEGTMEKQERDQAIEAALRTIPLEQREGRSNMKVGILDRAARFLGCATGACILTTATLGPNAVAGETGDGSTRADEAGARQAEATAAASMHRFVPYGKMEKVAFIGVSTQPVDESLSRQLGLTRGTGLLVTHVDQGSPAAGKLEEHDVLRAFEGQVLVNQEQLAVLVRTNKPGSKVTVELTRQAKPLVVTLTLGEKEMPALVRSSTGMALDPQIIKFLGGTNSPVRIQMRSHSAGDASSGAFPGFGASSKTVTSHFNGMTGVTTMNTDDHTLTVTTEGNTKTLRVTTRDGKEVFNGPVTTEEDRAKIPASLKDDLREIEQLTKGIQVHVAPQAD